MLPVDDALAQILAAMAPLPTEWLPLDRAHGRILAQDLTAPRDQPPQAISAMDGYAVRAADLAAGEARLRLIGTAPAGGRFAGTVGPGETVRIFTGGPLPDGADAVALQENASPEADGVRLLGRIEPGTFVRRQGLDIAAGALGLAGGTRLGARALGLAAALDQAWLPVRRQPRVGVLATGDELVRPGGAFDRDQIASSNSVALSAMVQLWGGQPVDLGILPDQVAATAALVPELRALDLVVTTGGASVGERDLVRQVLGEHGLELAFWQLAMRPGKPVLFGRLNGVPLLGLPGNPVSACVCAILFLRPAMLALQGADPSPPLVPAVLGRALGANDRREEYLRASASWQADGRLEVVPAERQDSAMLATLARADCLIKRPALAPAMPVGSQVQVIPLAGLGLHV